MRTLIIFIYLTIVVVGILLFIKECKTNNSHKKSNIIKIILTIVLMTVCFYFPFFNPINKNTHFISITKCCLINDGSDIRIDYDLVDLDEISEETLISLLSRSFSVRRKITKEEIDVEHYDIYAKKYECSYSIIIFRNITKEDPRIICRRFVNGTENAEWVLIPTDKDYVKMINVLD